MLGISQRSCSGPATTTDTGPTQMWTAASWFRKARMDCHVRARTRILALAGAVSNRPIMYAIPAILLVGRFIDASRHGELVLTGAGGTL
jgi:hypothetical protein